MYKKELVQSIKEKRLASFVTENWWHMPRSDLKGLVVQLVITMYDNDLTEENIDMEELLERLHFD